MTHPSQVLEFKQVTECGHSLKIIREAASEDDKVAFLLHDIGGSIRNLINFGPIQRQLFGESTLTLKIDIHF